MMPSPPNLTPPPPPPQTTTSSSPTNNNMVTGVSDHLTPAISLMSAHNTTPEMPTNVETTNKNNSPTPNTNDTTTTVPPPPPPPHTFPPSSSLPTSSPALASSPVGVIFPPVDQRSIIDKTAQFGAKNGPEFETRIMAEQQHGNRFSFLFPNNPYRAYYEMKVHEFITGTEGTTQPAVPQAILEMRQKDDAKKKEKQQLLMLTTSAMRGEDNEDGMSADGDDFTEDNLKPPPVDIYSIPPPFVAPVDIDVIKTTAQFVARNGQRFLLGLSQRERNNPQFEFLKPTHALFGYFTSLVEAYTKCLMPPANEITKLKQMALDYLSELPVLVRRYKWQVNEENKKKEMNRQQEQEKAQLASIEWHDFTVVETIEFTEEDESNESLAAPIDFVLLAQSARPAPPMEASASRLPEMTGPGLSGMIEVIKEAEDMEMDEEDKREEATRQLEEEEAIRKETQQLRGHQVEQPTPTEPDDEMPLPSPVGDGEVRVVKNYVRSARRGAKRSLDPSRLQKCPITGQLVSADQMSEHLRILLLDPKWKEEKDKLLEKAKKDSAFAPMSDVEGNLGSFVLHRPDLFGNIEDI
eukprot:GHVS01031794.1.p1 GENE.GHVS01031794.1~~GHVS01031794.1.p1  ORF type:complete len:579 (-),score=154.26 GHVS01031794.1:468-2204(-)